MLLSNTFLLIFRQITPSYSKKKWSHFDLNTWVSGGTKIRPGIPSNWRIFESNRLDIESWLKIDYQYRVNLTQIFSTYLESVEFLVPLVTQFFRSKWLHFFFQSTLRLFPPCLRTLPAKRAPFHWQGGAFGPIAGGFGQAPGGFGEAPGGFGQAPGGFGEAPGGMGQAPGGGGCRKSEPSPGLWGSSWGHPAVRRRLARKWGTNTSRSVAMEYSINFTWNRLELNRFLKNKVPQKKNVKKKNRLDYFEMQQRLGLSPTQVLRETFKWSKYYIAENFTIYESRLLFLWHGRISPNCESR